jgi:hypothetical protein
MSSVELEITPEGLKKIDNFIQDVADKVFLYSQENIVNEGKIDSAFLLKTANINRGVLEAEIVYPAAHAEVVHWGRSPGTMPPVDKIKQWAIRKLRVPEKEADQVAFAIATSIKQRGIDAFPFLQMASDKVEKELATIKVR